MCLRTYKGKYQRRSPWSSSHGGELEYSNGQDKCGCCATKDCSLITNSQ